MHHSMLVLIQALEVEVEMLKKSKAHRLGLSIYVVMID